ncbi:hypothetical protein WN943_025401 [Citrus x changshan-huyou]
MRSDDADAQREVRGGVPWWVLAWSIRATGASALKWRACFENPTVSETERDAKAPRKSSSIRIQVITKPVAVSGTKVIAKSENKSEDSTGLQSLCQNYDTDDE